MKMNGKLRSQRAGHRSAVKRLLKKFNEEIQKSEEERDTNEVKSTIKSLTNKRTILEDLDARILDYTPEEDVEKEIEDADGYVFEIEKTLSKFETFSQSNMHAQPATNQTEFSLNPNAPAFPEGSSSYLHPMQNQTLPLYSSQGNFSNTSTNSSQYHKLPKLNMPTFDGNILNWQSFWDSFSSA